MSTPSGKPFDAIRISDYAPKKVRERLASGDERSSADHARVVRPLREPQAPAVQTQPETPSNERPPAPPAAVTPAAPHERSEEGWQRHAGAGEEPEDARSYDAKDADDEQRDYGEDEYSEDEAYADETESEAGPQEAYAAHSEAYDVDLQRLEDDLQALRREGGDVSQGNERSEARENPGRLPPAGQLPPVRDPQRSRNTYIDGIRLPRSLEPSYVPPPPMRDRPNHLGAVWRVLVACAVAAPITYFLVYYFSAVQEPPGLQRGAKVPSVETQLASLPPMPAPQVREAPPAPPPQAAQPKPAQPPAVPQAQVPPPTPQPAPQPAAQPPQQITLAAPSAPSLPPQKGAPNWPTPNETSGIAPAVNPSPSPVRRPASVIDPEEVAVLLKQGEQFISAGDVTGARVLFERAAEAGNAKGALALGATYDPSVLAKLGVRGIAPDVAKARQWYEKARDLGSAEALGRLQALVSR